MPTNDGVLICPGCYRTIERQNDECSSCRGSVWLDGKLALLEPLGKDHPNVFRGLLRQPEGHIETVAVKVLDVGGLREWREHDRFRAQTRILDALADLSVPRPLGDLERGGRVFHCQTLLRGTPIGVARPIAELETLAAEILTLVGQIHARGVVHRDLKPEHVLIDEKGRAQLLDFGSARRFGAADDAPSIEPTVVGTPGYMAPEQTLGDARVESDLYAVGRILQAALGGRPAAGRLNCLIRRLGHPDWRKRPHSAAAALALLRPAPAARLAALGGLACLTVIILSAGVFGVRWWRLHHPSAPAPSSLRAAANPPPVERVSEDAARALLIAWQEAQNEGDFARYSGLYAGGFSGIKRTANGKSQTLGRAEWLAGRQKMFGSSLEVQVDALTASVDASAQRVTLLFVQRFRSGKYSDHGMKRMVIAQLPEGRRIVSEDMLDSRPGWDEEEYRRRFPAHGATCAIAFDPSEHAYLVALSHFDDYQGALRAAGKARKRGVDVEIVWDEDFEELEPGYWVLSGATDDEADARAIAARTRGRVIRVRASRPKFPSVLRLAEERYVDSRPELITTFGDTAYVVNDKEASAWKLDGDQLTEKFRVPMPRSTRPVRVGVRDGRAFVLDDQGHWSLIAEGGITQTRSFDPEAEGRIAVFGPHRFEIEDAEVAYRFNEGEVHRFPLLTKTAGVWRIGADWLLLFREDPTYRSTKRNNLFLFAVGDTPPRLTKVCGAVAGELTEAAHVTIGEIDLDTDREGGFEIWSSQWGFFAPSVDASPVCPEETQGECTNVSHSDIDADVWLFRRPKLEVEASASCYEDCADC